MLCPRSGTLVGLPSVNWCSRCEDARLLVKWVGTRESCVQRLKGDLEIKDCRPKGEKFAALWPGMCEAAECHLQNKRDGNADAICNNSVDHENGFAESIEVWLLFAELTSYRLHIGDPPKDKAFSVQLDYIH